jgi:hypothetical protein
LINSHMANCLWDDYEGHRKLHIANWHLICMKKEYGRIGIPDMKELNLCLLGSWVKRYIMNEHKLWRNIIEEKYCKRGNIFHSDKTHASPFWKGVFLAAQALIFGYRWIIGDGCKIRFWENIWFGSTPLAVQFWDLFTIYNEKTKTVDEVWVDGELRLTFRRTFSERMLEIWDELMIVVENVVLWNEIDALVWCYNSAGVYSSQSMYVVINYRGVTLVYVPAVWKINVPPKIQFFLWLLSHNKLATIDNLNKRGMSKLVQCQFCAEDENIRHLFFECCVAKVIWNYTREFLRVDIGSNYMYVAAKGLSGEKAYITNIISSAVVRGLWLIKNEFVFNDQVWSYVKMVVRRIWKLSMEWSIICKSSKMEEMRNYLSFLEKLIQEPLKIARD